MAPNAKIWFILSAGQTTGPFDPEEVEMQLPSLSNPQIWGRGHLEWVPPLKWRQLLRESGHLPQNTTHGADQSLWHVRQQEKELKPLRYPELLEFLKKQKDFAGIAVRPQSGSSLWKEVYAFPHLVEDLGISRRSHARVPIVGTLEFTHDEKHHSCRVISISEGGFGVNDAHDLQIGMRFQGSISSPNLYVTITSQFEVVYVSGDGYAGMQFIDLPDEFKNSIIEYVNKFATHS